MLLEEIILNNGVKMPILGFGTYKLGSFDETKEAVKNAILLGVILMPHHFMVMNKAMIIQ